MSCAPAWCTYYKEDYVPLFPSQVKYLVSLMYLRILYNCLRSDYYCVLHHGTYKALVMYTNNECATVRVMAKAVLNKLLPGLCLAMSLSSDEASALIHHLVMQLTHLLSKYRNSAENELSILNEFLLTNENYQVLQLAAEEIMENSTSPDSENAETGNTETGTTETEFTGTLNTETENAESKKTESEDIKTDHTIPNKTETGCTEAENAAAKLMWIVATNGAITSNTNGSVVEDPISLKQKQAGFHKIILDLQQATALHNHSVIRRLVHVLINLATDPQNRLVLTYEGVLDALEKVMEIGGMEEQLAAKAISLIMDTKLLQDVSTLAGMLPFIYNQASNLKYNRHV